MAKKTQKKESLKKSPANIVADELVVKASIKAKIEADSGKVIILNTSYNELLLNTGMSDIPLRIAPKEIKTIDRSLYKELMKNRVVKNWFDKGVLATKKEASEVSAHGAKIPENLKNPVERTDSVSTVSASVKKFEKDGTIQINL